MENKISLDETKVLEIQNTNRHLALKADEAIQKLELATRNKDFSPDVEIILRDVEDHGKEISRALKYWDDFIGPVVSNSYNLWKMLKERQKVVSEPLEEKKKRAALAVGAYRVALETERKRIEQEELKRREREAEEERIKQALELEKEGKKDDAEELISAPIFVPPVVMSASEKTKGVSVREVWKFKVINEKEIPREFLKVDEVKLGSYVRTFKEESNIPGIMVYAEQSASFSTK